VSEEQYYIKQLEQLQEWAGAIGAEWNGDLPGRLEDRAHLTSDLKAKCQEAIAIVKELEEDL